MPPAQSQSQLPNGQRSADLLALLTPIYGRCLIIAN